MSRSEDPMVSIIMPVYNGARFIEAAIRSVISQSYSNVELLIVNDGSTDDTEEIVFRERQTDARIRYFKQENKGVASARNLGLRNMKGSFFGFLDCDDILTRESIELRLNKFHDDEGLAFCDGGVIVYDETLRMEERSWRPSFKGCAFNPLLRLSESCFFGPTWLIKRHSSFHASFDEDMTHGEDLFFFITIAKTGRYDYVDETILRYRSSGNSAMRNLRGLANGYHLLYNKILDKFASDMRFFDKIYLWIRIKRIMVLSFLDERDFLNALRFLFVGKVK